jgi:hypothetical protein
MGRLFGRDESEYDYGLNTPGGRRGRALEIEHFHNAVVKRYREASKFVEDLSAQRLDVEVVRQGFNILLRCIERLIREGHIHYWLARAFEKQHPEACRNRFFVSYHFCAVDAAWRFLDLKNIDDWKDVSVINALRKPELLPWKVGLEELARIGDRNRNALRDLDAEYLSALQSEMRIACELMTESAPTEEKTQLPITAADIEVLLGEEGNKILSITGSKDSSDRKMRCICDIDLRYQACDSIQWASLLKVTPAAIRKTAFWRELQKSDCGRMRIVRRRLR